MVDVSKIRVGDEVTVRGKVAIVHHDDTQKPVRLVGGSWIEAADIISHTPAPRAFEPGDIVLWNGNKAHHWSLEAQADGFAFLKYVRCLTVDDFIPKPENRTPMAVPISDLRHADESE